MALLTLPLNLSHCNTVYYSVHSFAQLDWTWHFVIEISYWMQKALQHWGKVVNTAALRFLVVGLQWPKYLFPDAANNMVASKHSDTDNRSLDMDNRCRIIESPLYRYIYFEHNVYNCLRARSFLNTFKYQLYSYTVCTHILITCISKHFWASQPGRVLW